MDFKIDEQLNELLKKEMEAFQKTYETTLKRFVVGCYSNEIVEVIERAIKVIDYNVPFGKRNRGMSVISTYLILTGGKENSPTEEALEDVRMLGWVVELFQAAGLVADDIMDQSETRRGQYCWYKKPEVGLEAVNDSLLLFGIMFTIMSIYFEGKPFQKHALNLAIQVFKNTSAGEALDLSFSPSQDGKVDLSRFNKGKYEQMIKFKTAFYSLVFPVRFGMYAAGINDEQIHEDSEQVLLKIGQYFQSQDDYLDCFGDPKVTGKIGMDIVDGKCCWPIVEALKLVNPRQLQILRENYGVKDQQCEKLVKTVYDELGLAARFQRWEEDTVKDLNIKINMLYRKHGVPKEVFEQVIAKLFRRKK